MKIKKFVAPTMPEAMQKIRKELGSDAIILKSKEIKEGGFLGLFKKRKLEVIAALDPKPLQQDVNESRIRRKIPMPREEKMNEDVLYELKQLKQIVRANSSQQKVVFPKEYQVVYEYLRSQELKDKYAREIVNSVMMHHGATSYSSENIGGDIQYELEKRIKDMTFEGIRFNKKIVHFVGPTGVGKTTTIAKVAADSVVKHKKKVAFITTDTYRIAAIEQLKTYAKILDIPIEVAYTAEDYRFAIDKFSTFDLILVDTAGRNFRESKYINELKSRIDLKKDIEIYLVLSLTSKPNDLLELQEQFRNIPIKEYIFTKLDETRQYGSMISLMLNSKTGIAYLTNGQDVPNDMIKPSARYISELIMEDYMNG